MKPERFVFVFLAIASLIAGMWTGLTRMGLDILHLNATAHHGAIMVGGFLGTLISLEKAIPLQKKMYLVIPVISASSIVFFVTGHFTYSLLVLILASIGLCMIYAAYLIRQYDLTLLLMFLGALCWMVGNVLLLTRNFYPLSFPWWMAFLLFTIVAERLELSKFLPVTKANKNVLLIFLGIFLLGTLLPFHGYGTYFSGAGLIMISAWLMRFDVVRITIKKKGLTRFTGIALLSGYIALFLDGVFLITFPNTPYAYDAILHTFFIGFIFSMIFAHGPIIFPGVLGSSVKPFHPMLYVPLALLILSVIVRVSADADLIPNSYRLTSGWISTAGILLYLATMMILLTRGTRHATVL
jgi:hypothetical protein